MRLILARHGNTFEPGDPVVWAGSHNDFPLAQRGLEQAQELSAALQKLLESLVAVYCGTLLRTKKTAEMAAAACSAPLVADPRLDEIDYGGWSGLGSAEVISRFGREALENWERRSQWPDNSGWGASAALVERETQEFFDEMRQRHQGRTVLAVSSNGRLRYFLRCVPGAWEKYHAAAQVKVAPGNICILAAGEKNAEIICWNKSPAALADYV